MKDSSHKKKSRKRKVNRPHHITQTINEYDEKSADTYQMKYFVMLIKNENAADKAGHSTPPAQIIYNVLIISSAGPTNCLWSWWAAN